MCKAFSCLVTKSNRVYWKAGVDSHDKLRELFSDLELRDDKNPPHNTFARIEITPPDNNYLNIRSKWEYKIDESIKPEWLTDKHEILCRTALSKWKKGIYIFNLKEAKNPIHPFKIEPPKITKKHIALVKRWDSVWASVRDSFWVSVRASVWDSVRDSVWASVRASAGIS